MIEKTELEARIEALEESVETVCRPLADLLPPERVNGIERTGYEAQLKIAALEARVANLEAVAAEALQKSNAMLNSNIWRALVKGSVLLLRITGRSARS
jgi:hypothetical protein